MTVLGHTAGALGGGHVMEAMCPGGEECLELLAYKDHKKQTDFKSVLPTMFSLIACAQGTAFPPNPPSMLILLTSWSSWVHKTFYCSKP